MKTPSFDRVLSATPSAAKIGFAAYCVFRLVTAFVPQTPAPAGRITVSEAHLEGQPGAPRAVVARVRNEGSALNDLAVTVTLQDASGKDIGKVTQTIRRIGRGQDVQINASAERFPDASSVGRIEVGSGGYVGVERPSSK